MLEKLAELLGATGLVLGIFYLLYKQVISKVKLPGLSRKQAFSLLVITLLLIWSIAIIVILTDGGGIQSGGININNVSGSVNVD
ncbi:hypothetical protein C8N43_0355 [Litoreibacter ponti]|uniref:Uncharacterized protein n=1 Tax=Litoreibacter ponti TaxID=1510457 RepID=A0A2T6BI36_9RHOB|nr:hypothetical protein [Litoreibacter ponti]PTX55714.1 hypothetical protein C8N43_0355 [Litoreibacter ponti]